MRAAMVPAATIRPLDALAGVLDSVEAVRNGRALFVLLATFSTAGLLLAMADVSLAGGRDVWGAIEAGAALTVAFYGGNATGLLLMDQARGLPPRDVADAVRDALALAHRLLVVMLAVAAAGLLLATGIAALLWTARAPLVGPALFGLAVPLSVVVLGAALLAAVAVIGPLAAPAVWSGRSVRATLALLARHVRERLLATALLMGAVSLLAAAVAGLVTFAVVAGGRAVAALAVLAAGVDVPPQQLMAGLFGHGLRSLGATGAPVLQSPHGAAALVGGGVVFALALALPALVYLRGACAVFLALDDVADAA
jgi:hypothetical protein